MSKIECVAETVAKEGEFVICVGHRADAQIADFTIGRRYKVIRFGSQLCVAPNSMHNLGARIPRVGYGAYWKKAAE